MTSQKRYSCFKTNGLNFYSEIRFPIFFKGLVLAMRDKNATVANEESVLLIDAEHCRIEKSTGSQIVTCQADNLCKFLAFNE